MLSPAGVRPYYFDTIKDWVEFVDVEDVLPARWAATRNSHTIEWHLEELKTLKQLTDPLIMLNDDWMVVNKFDLVRCGLVTVQRHYPPI